MRWDMNKSGASRKGQDTKNQNCSNSEPVSRTRFGERFPAGIVTPRVVSERTTAGAAKRVRQHGTAVTFHTPTHRSMRPPVCHLVLRIDIRSHNVLVVCLMGLAFIRMGMGWDGSVCVCVCLGGGGVFNTKRIAF